MNRAAREFAEPGAASSRHGSAVPGDRSFVAESARRRSQTAAPDRIDHRMIGAGGGVGGGDRGIGAEMPGQIERQLHARREFRKALVDAELEKEGAVLMPEYDSGRDRCIAGTQRHDLALASLGECRRGAADEGGVAFVLAQRGAALALPAAGFQPQENFERRCDCSAFARPRNGPRRARPADGAGGAVPSASCAPARRAAIRRPRAWRRGRREAAIAARADASRPAAAPRERLSWRRHRAIRRAGSAHGRRSPAPPAAIVRGVARRSRSSAGCRACHRDGR